MPLHEILLKDASNFIPESEFLALSRYQGFAENFFVDLYVTFPSLKGKFKFFRDVKNNSDDIWSICEINKPFGVQLDPDIECICIWDTDWHDEIGSWIDNPAQFTFEIIKKRYLEL